MSDIICSSEDGDWYALDGAMSRDEAIAALLHIGVELEPESSDSFALNLSRSHIAKSTKRERKALGWDHQEYDDWWIEVAADRKGAREVWIAS